MRDPLRLQPPKPTGVLSVIDADELTGLVFPCREDDQPVFVSGGGNSLYWPLFDNADDLIAMMRKHDIPYYKIRQVDDGVEFYQSFVENGDRGVCLMVRPHYGENGKLRFMQLPEPQ